MERCSREYIAYALSSFDRRLKIKIFDSFSELQDFIRNQRLLANDDCEWKAIDEVSVEIKRTQEIIDVCDHDGLIFKKYKSK